MKKKVNYSSHLIVRMNLREIPYNLPMQIYRTASESYFDLQTGNYAAVKKTWYKDKWREMVVVYREEEEEIKLITIHPLKPYQKEARITSGRWKKDEKKTDNPL